MISEDGFGLDLANGTSLRLLAEDKSAVPVVELLAGSMALRPSSGRGRMLLAAVRGGRAKDVSYRT